MESQSSKHICIHLAGCQFENHPLPSKKAHAEIRAAKQTWQHKEAAHSTKKSRADFQEDYVLRKKVIPNLLFHMVIYHLFSDVGCLTLLLHWWAPGLWHFPLWRWTPIFSFLQFDSIYNIWILWPCLQTAWQQGFAAGQKTKLKSSLQSMLLEGSVR